MKIVIIGRIIYPLLSPRAFRATELAKEFARLGHDVTLYGVLGDYNYVDFSEQTKVKIKSIKMALATSNSDGKVRYNILDKIAYHALGNIIEYPDIEFCWKIPQILKKEKGIDLLITIAVPHPIHWGAAIAKKILKKKFPKLWISDCGDPFWGNTVGRKKKFYFKQIEKFWGNQTDYVTVPVDAATKAYLNNVQNKIRIIPQGFNMENVALKKYYQHRIPHFAYAGSVYPGKRDPSSFLEYLCEIKSEFVFTVYTNNEKFFSPFKQQLKDKLIINNYIPRENLLAELSEQDFLINFVNPKAEQSPSKLIDYYLTKRPILDISTPFKEQDSFNKALQFELENWHKPADITKYDIRNVAQAFLALTDQCNE